MSNIVCPKCNGQFETDKQEGMVFCLHCGNQIDLQTLAPEAAAENADMKVDPKEVALLDYAKIHLESSDPPSDESLLAARGYYRDILSFNDKSARAWKGLFDCQLWAAKKSFASIPKIEGTEYWLASGKFVDTEWFQVESYFCRAEVRRGIATPHLCDEILQPGRTAQKHLEKAIEFGNDTIKQECTALREEYLERPLAELPDAGKRAALAKMAEKNAPKPAPDKRKKRR